MLCFPVSIKKACGTSVAAEPGGTARSILAQPASLLKTRSLGMSGIWTLCLPPRSDGVDYICLDSAPFWNCLLPLLTARSYFSLVLAPLSLSITEQGSLYHLWPCSQIPQPSVVLLIPRSDSIYRTTLWHAWRHRAIYICLMLSQTEQSSAPPHDLITHTPFPFLPPPVFSAFLSKITESHPRVTYIPSNFLPLNHFSVSHGMKLIQ